MPSVTLSGAKHVSSGARHAVLRCAIMALLAGLSALACAIASGGSAATQAAAAIRDALGIRRLGEFVEFHAFGHGDFGDEIQGGRLDFRSQQ